MDGKLKKIILGIFALFLIGFTVFEWNDILCSKSIQAEVKWIEEVDDSDTSKIYVTYENKDGVEESSFIMTDFYSIRNDKIKILYNSHTSEIYPMSKITIAILLVIMDIIVIPVAFIRTPFKFQNKYFYIEINN